MEVAANAAPAADAGSVAPVTTTTDSGEPLSLREAASIVHKRRETPDKPAQPRVNGKFASPQAEDAAQAVEHDAPAEVGAETDPAVDPAEQPSIDPPRSWTKDEKEAFKALPPEHQQRIAERERARELEIRRGQNEAAETRKAAEAERKSAEQARQRYEAVINESLQAIQQSAEFADIKTHADVQKMAQDDPFRFVQWQARQQQVQQLQQQARTLAEQRKVETQQAFAKWAAEQDKLFTEQAKEFADPEKAAEARKEVVSYLTDVRGLSQDRLGKLWSGQEPLYIRSAEAQLIIRDAAKWHAAQKKATAAVQRPVPPVQRPGTASSKGDASANIQALTQKLDKAGTTQEQIRAAAALRAAKRAAR